MCPYSHLFGNAPLLPLCCSSGLRFFSQPLGSCIAFSLCTNTPEQIKASSLVLASPTHSPNSPLNGHDVYVGARLCSGVAPFQSLLAHPCCQERHGPRRAAAAAWEEERELQGEHIRSASAWLRADGPLELYIVRRVLEPQQRLIHKLLQQTSHLKELEWMELAANQERRPYKSTALALGCENSGLFYEYLTQVARQLSDASLWEACQSVEGVAVDIFRMQLRGAAVCYELLVMRCQCFPMLLFRALAGTQYAREILDVAAASPCLVDSFSKRHLDAFGTPEALNSQESLMVLRTTAMLFQGTTFSTETVHSKSTRRSKNRMTHFMSLHDLSMWYQVSASPAFLKVLGT